MRPGQMDSNTLRLIISRLCTEAEDDPAHYQNMYLAPAEERTKSSSPSLGQAERRCAKSLLLHHRVPYILNANMGLPMPMLLNSLGSSEIIQAAQEFELPSSDPMDEDYTNPLPGQVDISMSASDTGQPNNNTSKQLTGDSPDTKDVERCSSIPARRLSADNSSSSSRHHFRPEQQTQIPRPSSSSKDSLNSDNDRDFSITQFVDSTMHIMDHLFSASFYDYLRDESNALHIARHLSTIVTDYSLKRVAVGIRWLVSQWSLENVHLFLRRLTQDWYPDVTALLITLVTSHWPVDPELTFLVSRMLRGESPSIAALFLKTIGSLWQNPTLEQELIWKVSQRLNWDEAYYQSFVNCYLALMIKLEEPSDSENYEMILFLMETWRDKKIHHLEELTKGSNRSRFQSSSMPGFVESPFVPFAHCSYGLPPASSLDFMKNLSFWDMDGLLMTTPPSPRSARRISRRSNSPMMTQPRNNTLLTNLLVSPASRESRSVASSSRQSSSSYLSEYSESAVSINAEDLAAMLPGSGESPDETVYQAFLQAYRRFLEQQDAEAVSHLPHSSSGLAEHPMYLAFLRSLNQRRDFDMSLGTNDPGRERQEE